MHLLVQSKLRLVSREHLPRNFYSQTLEATAVYAVEGRRVNVRLEGEGFHSVSYVAVPITWLLFKVDLQGVLPFLVSTTIVYQLELIKLVASD